MAEDEGKLACIEALIKGKVNVTLKNDKEKTPLELAKRFGYQECINFLQASGGK
ncbi:MAG: ankyrin repeat domain-containing protein [Candidatus Cardinium sp.]|nr:ankyrin repeat domain-containing protein [Candidatus Cardinium sp.]